LKKGDFAKNSPHRGVVGKKKKQKKGGGGGNITGARKKCQKNPVA